MAKKEIGPEAEKEKKPINLMLLLPILLVLAVVGSIAGTLLTNKFLASAHTSTDKKETVAGKISGEQTIVSMDEFLVNLSKSDKDQQYMKITLSLLVADEKTSAEVTKNIALIRDSAVNLLRQKTADDVLSNAESIPKLKEELKNTINHDYGKHIVSEVYITDLVVQ